LIDTSKINNLGWSANVGLREGVKQTIKEFEISQNDK